MNALVWRNESWALPGTSSRSRRTSRPAEEYREKMIEAAVEMDETALENYLNGNMPATTRSVR